MTLVIYMISFTSKPSLFIAKRHLTTANLTSSSGISRQLKRAYSLSQISLSFIALEISKNNSFDLLVFASRQMNSVKEIILINNPFTIGSFKCYRDFFISSCSRASLAAASIVESNAYPIS